jgi:nucleotide-binding universal stress UspA family protein
MPTKRPAAAGATPEAAASAAPERDLVVGFSDRPAAAAALEWAQARAVSGGARLVVIRAEVSREDVLAGASGRFDALEKVDPALARAVIAARTQLGEDRVTAVLSRDRPDEALVRAAGVTGILVIGAAAGPLWWARASTTMLVLARAAGPVVLVPATPGGPGQPGIGRVLRSHVVVGVDGSPAAHAALGFGFEQAQLQGLPVAAVTIAPHAGGDVWFDDQMLQTHLGVPLAEAELLDEQIQPWHLEFPQVPVKRAVVAGRPAEGLRRVAEGAALLVVGTSGGAALLGSVSRNLVDRPPCPLAVLRAPTGQDSSA